MPTLQETLEENLTALAQAVGADIKALHTAVHGAVPPLKPLLVYYGFPIAYKGMWNASAIARGMSAGSASVLGSAASAVSSTRTSTWGVMYPPDER